MDARAVARRWWFIAPIGAALVAHSLVFDFASDDAYISFVYSRNLAEHGQLVFNLGEKVEGYTNFLWTVLLAAFYKLGVQPDVAARVLGTVCGVVGLVAAVRVSARVRGKERPEGWDFLPAALLAASSGYACWCSGGLETQLFTMLFVVGVERWLAGRMVASGLAFAACAMTRPEGVMLFGLAAACAVAVKAARRERVVTRDEVRWAAAFVGLYAPYFAWRYWYYGDLLPNTAYVKTGGAPPGRYLAELHAQGAYYVWQWATQSKAVYVAPLAIAGAVRPGAAAEPAAGPRFRAFGAFALTVVAVYLVYAWRVGGDFMGLHRFVMPLFVLVALLVSFGIGWAVELVPAAQRRAGSVVAVALVLGGFAWSQALLSRASLEPRADRGIDRPGYLKLYADNRGAIGRALAPLVHVDELSWVGGVGVQPYYGRMRAYDVFGLVSRRVAHEVPPSRPRPGHQKWAPAEMVLATDPTFIFYCYSIHPDRGTGGLCGEAGFFQARGYEACTIFVPGAQNEGIHDRRKLAADTRGRCDPRAGGSPERCGMYYTFLKKKGREFPCVEHGG